MFNKLKATAIKTAYRFARKKGVNCPDCLHTLELPAKMPIEEHGEVLSCHHCSWKGSPSTLLIDTASNTIQSDPSSARPAAKPIDTKIQDTQDGESASFLIPAPKRINFFLFFAAFWLTITAIVSGGFLFAFITGQEIDGNASLWFILPFFTIFWAIGLGVLYLGIRTAFTEHLLAINDQSVTHLRKFFGVIKQRSFPRDQVLRVTLESAYQQNDTPVYELRILPKDTKAKPIKFGSHLQDDEKSWLHYSLKELLIPDANKPNNLAKNHAFTSHPTDGRIETIQDKNIELVPYPSGSKNTFKFNVKHLYPITLIAIATILIIPIFFMLSSVMNDLDLSRSETPFFLKLINSLFTVIPAIIALGFTIISITCFIIGFMKLGTTTCWLFEKDQLTISKYKKTHLLKETTYPKSSFNNYQSRQSGNVNNQPRHSLKLTGSAKSLTIHSFIKPQHLSTLEAALSKWLHS